MSSLAPDPGGNSSPPESRVTGPGPTAGSEGSAEGKSYARDEIVLETQQEEEEVGRSSQESSDSSSAPSQQPPLAPDTTKEDGPTSGESSTTGDPVSEPQAPTSRQLPTTLPDTSPGGDPHDGDTTEEKPRATLNQLAIALFNSLQATSARKPRLQAWLDLMQQLFAEVCPKSPVKRAHMTAAAQRLPKLKKLEQERLIDLFEDIVIRQQREWTEWRALIEGACLTVYKSRQSLEYVLSKQVGKFAVQEAAKNAPVLTQWAQKIAGHDTSQSSVPPAQKAFLFHQGVYTTDETARLRRICETTYGKHTVSAFREGSEDEWRIVQGLVEGTILCRRLPQFINRIMATEFKLRIIGTIRAQVEGKLIMDLDGELPIKEAFRSTKSLQESISTAVTNRGTDNQNIWSMLAAVKTISYNAACHEIHLHFFTRAEAQRHEKLEIPFHRQVHALTNAHATAPTSPDSSVWDRQFESDGGPLTQEIAYVVTLRNVARTMDLSRFHSFLQHVLAVPFDLNDLDLGGPNSSTSTAWELSFSQEGCPDALLGIKRIMWFNSVIVVQHPAMRGRQQCLRCGGLGHPMRLCNLSASALKLPVQPATFKSLAELKDAMSQCRLVRDTQPIAENTLHEDQVQAGVSEPKRSSSVRNQDTHATQGAGWFDGGAKGSRRSNKVGRATDIDSGPADLNHEAKHSSNPPPRESNKDRNKPMQAGSRFNPLVIDSSNESTPPDQDGQAGAVAATPRLSTKEMQQVHAELLVTEDAAKAQLAEALGLASRSKVELQRKGFAQRQRGDAPHADAAAVALNVALRVMGLRRVQTHKTGNCQVYSIAQAMANDSLGDQPTRLTQAATALKAGCVARALIDFSLKYPHGQRKQTLLRLGRGYERMAAPVSEMEFRKYLTEYGSSPSEVDVFIPGNVWGSNDTLAAYGMLLQRDIIVISYIPGTSGWSALHYEPETRHAKQRDYSTCGEYPLSAAGCVRKVQELTRRAECAGGNRPIVLHYAEAHYSAYIFPESHGADGDVDMADSGDADHTEELEDGEEEEEKRRIADQSGPTRQHRSSEGTRYISEKDSEMNVDAIGHSEIGSCSSQSPWDPEDWDGNLDELERRLQGPTIHHALKLEINQILRAGGERTKELLHFLVETVTQLSLPEQQRLLAADLNDPAQCKDFVTEFQIPEPVVRQWQRQLEREQESGSVGTESPASAIQLAQSDPDYYPSTSQSTDDDGVRTPVRPRRILQRSTKPPLTVKRTHVTTPEDRREEAGNVVNVDNRAVPLKKRSSDDPTKNLLTLFEDADTPAQPSACDQGQLPSWPIFWSANARIWQERTKVPFPEVEADAAVWVRAARAEPDLLLHLIRTFSHPHEILQCLPPQATTELIENWRVECWSAAVKHAQQVKEADPIRVSRLAKWHSRAEAVDQHHLRKAIINSPDEWTHEKNADYGRDAIMRLCSPDRINRIGSYLLSAIVYAEKIAALTGLQNSPDDSPVILLQRHLDAIRKIPEYKTSFLARDPANTIRWDVFGQYMSRAVAEKNDGAPTYETEHLRALQY